MIFEIVDILTKPCKLDTSSKEDIFMSTIITGPNVPQVGGTGSTNLANRPNAEVANFMGQLTQSCRVNEGIFNPDRIEQLASRSVVPAESQSASAAPSSGGTAPASLDLEELAKAIETGKSQIGIGTKFLAWIKSWFGSDSFDTAIAKQAFRNIKNQETQTALLTLAFGTAALSEKSQNNMQIMLNFCQAINVTTNNIAMAINSIPDLAGKTRAFKVLVQSALTFNPDSLPKFESDVAKELILELAKAGQSGARYLQLLLEKHKLDNLVPDKAFVLDLAKVGQGGARYLQQLLENHNLDSLVPDKAFVLELAKVGQGGAGCLKLLLENHNLDSLVPDKAFVLDLAKVGQGGAGCLKLLLENHNLDSLVLDKAFVLELAKVGQGGAGCLKLLLEKHKPDNLTLDETFVLELAKVGQGGAGCLKLLLQKLSLKDPKLGILPMFSGTDARQLILDLAKGGANGAECLQLLLENHKLDILPMFSNTDSRQLILDLANVGQGGTKCLQLLLEKLQQLSLKDPKLDILPMFSGTDARQLILDLAKGGANGAECLQLLLENHKLDNPILDKAFVLDLAKVGQGGAECLQLLLQKLQKLLLEDPKLDILPKFESNVAKELILELANVGQGGAECLKLLLQKLSLENSKLDILPMFSNTDSRQLILDLANVGQGGAKCLQLLREEDKLDDSGLKPNDIKVFVLELAKDGVPGINCLGIFLTALSNIPILEPPEAKELVENLAKAGQSSVYYLNKLFEGGKLQNLRLKGLNTPADVKTKVLELIQKGQLDELRSLLEG
jgi:anti-anti-sigma regulatory factor